MPETSAKEVILELLRAGDGEWTGKTRLFKGFYFAHLYFSNNNPGLLTDSRVARMPEGPGIDNGDQLLRELIMEHLLTAELVHEGPYPEYRYRLTEAGMNLPPPSAAAQKAIRLSATFCEGKTAAELSRLTHEKSRSWKQGKDGDILNIYIDTISDDDYERREREIQQLDEQMVRIFGGQQA
jgi:hypothetical protein